MQHYFPGFQYILKRFIIVLFGLFFVQTSSHAQILTGNFDFEERMRDYIVYLPSNYSSTSNAPLVLNLHGYGSYAEEEMTYTQMNLVADTAGFIAVYPNAIDNAWNSGVSDNPDFPTPNVNDVGFIDALIDTLNNHYSIDLEKIYACGMSNGDIMAYKLACQPGSRLAAVASVTGLLSTSTAANCTSQIAKPVLHIHGTADSIALYKGATGWYSAEQTLAHWIALNACTQVDTTLLPDSDPTDGCTVERIRYTNCFNNCCVVFYKVIHGGHTWPDAAFNVPKFGNTNRDINANVEIWHFFKTYNRSVSNALTSYSQRPIEYFLWQNYPNPFNPTTTIAYDMPKAYHAHLLIYDILGRHIRTLVDRREQASRFHTTWDGMDKRGMPASAGVYLCRMQAGEYTKVVKMVLVR